jgi:hypothetical protein
MHRLALLTSPVPTRNSRLPSPRQGTPGTSRKASGPPRLREAGATPFPGLSPGARLLPQ